MKKEPQSVSTQAVARERLVQSITALEAFGTRFAYASNAAEVTRWIADQFIAFGHAENTIHFQPFEMKFGNGHNVLCPADPGRLPGLVLCAHYDSKSELASVQKPNRAAPGADDNATGVAVLLEAARLLRGMELSTNILFAAFGGEEQRLAGSKKCARVAHRENWPIDLVVNLDMLAWQHKSHPNLIRIEHDKGNVVEANDVPSRQAADRMTAIAIQHGLEVERTGIINSDYMPFEKKGYTCIGVYEGGNNPNRHQSSDKLATLNMDHLTRVAQVVVDFLIQEAS